MAGEVEVRGRYEAYTQEMEQLDREIFLLKARIRMGSEHWSTDLEQLAGHTARRRALATQQQALSWVLTPAGNEAGATPAFG